MSEEFVGGGMVGVAAPPSPRFRASVTSTPQTAGTPVTGEPRAPLDPEASILCRDLFDRPIEIHQPGWEASVGLTRPFVAGEVVTIIACLHLTKYESGFRADDLHFNDVAALEAAWLALPKHGHFPATGCIDSWKHKAVVLDTSPVSYTLGLCPMYAVEIQDGPAKGVKLLAFPSELMNAYNRDGLGIDRVLRKKAEGEPEA